MATEAQRHMDSGAHGPRGTETQGHMARTQGHRYPRAHGLRGTWAQGHMDPGAHGMDPGAQIPRSTDTRGHMGSGAHGPRGTETPIIRGGPNGNRRGWIHLGTESALEAKSVVCHGFESSV